MSRWANKYVIGLTGNIATGKSVVRQMLQHLGAYTIDADGLTHRAMAPGAPAYKPIVETFGQFILDADKNIDRTMLGNIVFSRPEALAKLEAIVHPIVAQAIGTLVTRATQPVVVIEAIKILETDLANAVDALWVVTATPETQLIRLMTKRKMSEADARQRINAQGAQADKVARASLVIQNDGNVEDTWKQVQAGWATVQKQFPSAGAPPPAAPTLAAPARTAPAQPAAQPPAARPPAPAQPAAQAPRPAPAQPAPAQRPPAAPAPAQPAAEVKVVVRRGMPSNAEAIASFIAAVSGKAITRMDVMMSFGQKSYLIAQDPANRVLAVMGWQVENLITRVDEFYIAAPAAGPAIVPSLLTAIEEASKDLQSEVSYIFLPTSTSGDVIQAFLKSGYDNTTIEQIKIPAWREAVQETISDQGSTYILTKKLREDRVLKPI